MTEATPLRTRVRIYMNVDVPIPTIAASEGVQSAANARKRELATEYLSGVFDGLNPEFHSVRLVRSK